MKFSAYRMQRQMALGLVMIMASPFFAVSQQPLPSTDRAAAAGSQTSAQEPAQTGQPVGTAAAPYEGTSGVAASSPAGAVIAPAKQKRSHSLLIKLGLIIGGAAAVGTIVALSSSSPSRPN